MKKIIVVAIVFGVTMLFFLPKEKKSKPPLGPQLRSAITYENSMSIDQDDMCIWIHPQDPEKSLVISADKEANKIFVYDSGGNTLQDISCPKPGNIDVRYGFSFGGNVVDIVATTTRGEINKIVIFKIDVATRTLKRIDDKKDTLQKLNRKRKRSFGGAMYHNKKTNTFYFFKTDEDPTQKIEQFEMYDNGEGAVSLKKVREWPSPGKCEGAVADDENQMLYFCEERKGVWKLGANPQDGIEAKLVIAPKDNKYLSLEGIAFYKTSLTDGYLVVSRQYRSTFQIFDRKDQSYMGSFHIKGVGATDGLDITHYPIHSKFPKGAFICHSKNIKGTSWETIATTLKLESDSDYQIRD